MIAENPENHILFVWCSNDSICCVAYIQYLMAIHSKLNYTPSKLHACMRVKCSKVVYLGFLYKHNGYE